MGKYNAAFILLVLGTVSEPVFPLNPRFCSEFSGFLENDEVMFPVA